MTWLHTKAWPWIKAHWQWIIFPVGILSALIGVAAAAASVKDYPPPSDLDEETKRHLTRLRTADQNRNKQLISLEWNKREKLKELNAQQHEELVELRKKSTEEVVSWFNNL